MKENHKDLELEYTCFKCGKIHKVAVNLSDYNDWVHGTLAQKAFPYLNPYERDEIIAHICIDCQKELDKEFKED